MLLIDTYGKYYRFLRTFFCTEAITNDNLRPYSKMAVNLLFFYMHVNFTSSGCAKYKIILMRK